MRVISLAEIQPLVRIANYHPVAPGQSWPNRRIPDLQLILILRGEYEYLEEGQPLIQIHPGEVLLIEPGHRHTFRRADTLDAGAISGLHCELVAEGTWAAGDYRLAVSPERVTRVADRAYLEERFKRLAFVYRSYLPYRELQTGAIAREIFLLLASHWRQPARSEISARLQEMIKFIRAHLQQPLSRQDLAREFGISPEHVNLLFRKELGMTPSAVINRERVMLAYRLIHEKGYTVKEAAHEAGYSDPFYFSRVFKNVFGVPPSQVA